MDVNQFLKVGANALENFQLDLVRDITQLEKENFPNCLILFRKTGTAYINLDALYCENDLSYSSLVSCGHLRGGSLNILHTRGHSYFGDFTQISLQETLGILAAREQNYKILGGGK